jgi:hypothetical protein
MMDLIVNRIFFLNDNDMQNGTMFDDSHVIKKNFNRKAIAKNFGSSFS